MIKLVGAIMIVFATTYLGMNVSVQKRARVRQLFLLDKLAFEFAQEIGYSAEPHERLCGKYLNLEKYKELSMLDLDKLLINIDEKKELLEFKSRLGKNGREMQVILCENFSAKMHRLAEEAEKGLASDIKVINSVSFFGGIILSLLIL